MSLHAIRTDSAPAPAGPYSQSISANGFVFTAGFGPQDPATGAVPDGIEAQTAQLIRNLSAVLETQGTSLDRVVKATVHLQHLDRDFAAFNTVYREHFSEPFPVRTTVGSTLAGILVEIDVVALAEA